MKTRVRTSGGRCRVLGGLAIWGLPVSAAVAQTPEYFVKKNTWAETMQASRAAYAKRPQQKPLTLGPWSATGPHTAKGFSDALFPEQGVDLKAKDDQGSPLWQEDDARWGRISTRAGCASEGLNISAVAGFARIRTGLSVGAAVSVRSLATSATI